MTISSATGFAPVTRLPRRIVMMRGLSLVVTKFNIQGIAILPNEANAPLVVDAESSN